MKASEVWEILARFKNLCKRKHGWKTSEGADWIEAKNAYHNFVWVKNIHPSSFKRIARNNKIIMQEGLAYRVVESSYTAWLFLRSPSETLAKTILENPELSCKVALYDLGDFLDGKPICSKLNSTDSSVFKEFEVFLKNELGVSLQPFSLVADPKMPSDRCVVADLV